MRWNKKLKSASLYLILSVNIKRRINVIIRSPFTPLHFFYPFFEKSEQSSGRFSRGIHRIRRSTVIRRTAAAVGECIFLHQSSFRGPKKNI